MTKEAWPPNYSEVFVGRAARLRMLRTTPGLSKGALHYYRSRGAQGCIEFIEHWCDTYDPRNAGTPVPTRMPFVLFQRQKDLVHFLVYCVEHEQNGLIEKCRDMGATWVCAAFTVWMWLCYDGAAIGWGSRKEQLVDKIGDPDSIFQKIRMILAGMPAELLPPGFSAGDATYMKIINPSNDATITGEAGDNIGRGGRKTAYFKDESAHYERPELIEAALGDNTRVQIDISSVNGVGNVFHRRRKAGVVWRPGVELPEGKTLVFIMDWREHPAKTQKWYDARRKKAEDDGLLHLFAQEVDREYAASVEGVLIPALWVSAAIDAHLRPELGFGTGGAHIGGVDVADSKAGDKNAFAMRRGSVLVHAEHWGGEDSGATARRAVATCTERGYANANLQYDPIGVGSGVKTEANRLEATQQLPPGMVFTPWNAGLPPLYPEQRVIPGDPNTPRNKEFYKNLKAQGWWQLRLRFERTYKAVAQGASYDPDDLISLSSEIPCIEEVKEELSQPTASRSTGSMKLLVDKKPDGVRSPNLADSIVQAYWPVTKPKSTQRFGLGGKLIGS